MKKETREDKDLKAEVDSLKIQLADQNRAQFIGRMINIVGLSILFGLIIAKIFGVI